MKNRSEQRDLSKPEDVRGHFPDMEGEEVDSLSAGAHDDGFLGVQRLRAYDGYCFVRFALLLARLDI